MGHRSDRLAWTRFVETGEAKAPHNKYNALKTEVNGDVYDSEQEARRAVELEWRLSLGEITDLRRQVVFELVPRQGKLRPVTFRADFVYVEVESGRQVVEDVKGVRTAVFEVKRKLMLYIHGIEVVEIRYPKKKPAGQTRGANRKMVRRRS